MNNVTCTDCGGEGLVYIEEDGRQFEHACYHCGTTGMIDEELAFLDRLRSVASTLAARSVDARRRACNEDSEGEPWYFHAAENMMTEYDYTRVLVWELTDTYSAKLIELPLEMQEVLVAWNELPADDVQVIAKHIKTPVPPVFSSYAVSDENMSDDIPF